MAIEEDRTKNVTAIVPAYNEGERITAVLKVLTTYPGFSEVIVVDDGSRDNTARVAARFPVRLIQHETNLGKGKAMDNGVAAAQSDIIFFSDADVVGLTHEILSEIIAPVQEQKTDMVIGMRNRRIYYLSFILSVIPLLGGERAITQELWEAVPSKYKERFFIETALNFYARYQGQGFQYKVFEGLTQTIKEKKYGMWKGFTARVRMFVEVIRAEIMLTMLEIPATVKTARLAAAGLLGSAFGIVIGIAMLGATYTSPVEFLRAVFAQELQQDPDAPVVHLLLNIAANIGVDAWVALAVTIISLNVIVFLLNLKNVRYFFMQKKAPIERLP